MPRTSWKIVDQVIFKSESIIVKRDQEAFKKPP